MAADAYSSSPAPECFARNVYHDRTHDIDAAQLDAVGSRIPHQLRGRIEPHGETVEKGSGESRRMVVFEPRRDIDQQRETRGMRFREAVFAKALDLLEDALGKVGVVAVGQHAPVPAKLWCIHLEQRVER